MADALISPAVGGAAWAVSAAAVAYSTAKIKNELGDKKVPLMAVAGAFVFAAQMINFTIPATGSSGHIGGGILLAGLLGGFPALLTISAVLVIQCLFFADGGLLALGCNILNMGIIPCLVVYPLIFKPLVNKDYTVKRIGAASVLSVVVGLQIGAFGVVLETLLSGITALPFGAFVALMQPIHLAIGVVEGIITAAVLGFVFSMRPEILQSSGAGIPLSGEIPVKKVLIALGVAALIVGGLLSIFASAYPDGLEWAMEGVAGTAELETEGPAFRRAEAIQETTAFMPGYGFPSDEEGSAAGTAVAGIVGSLLTCVLAGLTGFVIWMVKKNRVKPA
ncbi:MAG: energy-coupling factor ABC transporter permease [Spirochaetaceae bacterium]|nr:energy-coupling factor ABC transporter permease [Spirochaetaceae bacterium]